MTSFIQFPSAPSIDTPSSVLPKEYYLLCELRDRHFPIWEDIDLSPPSDEELAEICNLPALQGIISKHLGSDFSTREVGDEVELQEVGEAWLKILLNLERPKVRKLYALFTLSYSPWIQTLFLSWAINRRGIEGFSHDQKVTIDAVSSDLYLINFWFSCSDLTTPPEYYDGCFWKSEDSGVGKKDVFGFFTVAIGALERLSRTQRQESLFRLAFKRSHSTFLKTLLRLSNAEEVETVAPLFHLFFDQLVGKAHRLEVISEVDYSRYEVQAQTANYIAGRSTAEMLVTYLAAAQKQCADKSDSHPPFIRLLNEMVQLLLLYRQGEKLEKLLTSGLVEELVLPEPWAPEFIAMTLRSAFFSAELKPLSLCWEYYERLGLNLPEILKRPLVHLTPSSRYETVSKRNEPLLRFVEERCSRDDWELIAPTLFVHSPLILAIKGKHYDLAKHLIHRGLHINWVGDEASPHYTALSAALKNGWWGLSTSLAKSMEADYQLPEEAVPPLVSLVHWLPSAVVDDGVNKREIVQLVELLLNSPTPLSRVEGNEEYLLQGAFLLRHYEVAELFIILPGLGLQSGDAESREWIKTIRYHKQIPQGLLKRLMEWHLGTLNPAASEHLLMLLTLFLEHRSACELATFLAVIDSSPNWKFDDVGRLVGDFLRQVVAHEKGSFPDVEAKITLLMKRGEAFPLALNSSGARVVGSSIYADFLHGYRTFPLVVESLCRTAREHSLFASLFPAGIESSLSAESDFGQFRLDMMSSWGTSQEEYRRSASKLVEGLSDVKELATMRRWLLVMALLFGGKEEVLFGPLVNKVTSTDGEERKRWVTLLGDLIVRQVDGQTGKTLARVLSNHPLCRKGNREETLPSLHSVLTLFVEYLEASEGQPRLWEIMLKYLRTVQQRSLLNREEWISLLDLLRKLPRPTEREEAMLQPHVQRVSAFIQIEIREQQRRELGADESGQREKEGESLKKQLNELIELEKELLPKWSSAASHAHSLLWRCSQGGSRKTLLFPPLAEEESFVEYKERCLQIASKGEASDGSRYAGLARKVSILQNTLVSKAADEAQRLRELPPFTGIVAFMKQLNLSPDEWNEKGRDAIKGLIKRNKQAATEVDQIKAKGRRLRAKMRDLDAALGDAEEVSKEQPAATAAPRTATEVFRERRAEIEALKGKRAIITRDLNEAQAALHEWHEDEPQLPEGGGEVARAIALLKGERRRRRLLGEKIVTIESLRAAWRNNIREEEYTKSLASFEKQKKLLTRGLEKLRKHVKGQEERLRQKESERSATWKGIRDQLEQGGDDYPFDQMDAFFDPLVRPTKEECRALFYALGFRRHHSDSKQGGTNHELIDVTTDQGEVQLSLTGHKESAPVKWKALVEYRGVVLARLRYLLANPTSLPGAPR